MTKGSDDGRGGPVSVRALDLAAANDRSSDIEVYLYVSDEKFAAIFYKEAAARSEGVVRFGSHTESRVIDSDICITSVYRSQVY